MTFTNLLFIFDGNTINIWIAFAAGILTFFASCLLPLVPSYLAYISGLSYSEIKDATGNRRKDIVLNSIIFTVGFVIAFIILGIIGNSLYRNLILYKRYFEIFAGLLFILLGLYNLDFFTFIEKKLRNIKTEDKKFFGDSVFASVKSFFGTELRVDIRRFLTKWGKLNSFIVGLGFGLAWTPCIGPVLGVILFWASEAETMLKGIYLLGAFGVGLGIPFILVGAGAEVILEKFKNFGFLQKIIGFVTLVVGIITLI